MIYKKNAFKHFSFSIYCDIIAELKQDIVWSFIKIIYDAIKYIIWIVLCVIEQIKYNNTWQNRKYVIVLKMCEGTGIE